MPVLVKKENVPLGVAVIVATVFTMAFADAIVKYVSSDLPLWQIFVVRSLIAIPILTVIFCIRRNTNMRANHIGWTLLRSFLLTFMYIAIYAAAPIVSLSVIAGSLYTGPLFITLISSLLLSERVGPIRWSAVLIGFVGVLMILQPQRDDFSIAMLVPIFAAIFYAFAAILTRSKCLKEEPLALALHLNYALLSVGLVMTAFLLLGEVFDDATKRSYPFLLGDWIMMGGQEWGILCFLAILIVTIGIGLAVAYQAAPAAIIATFDYSYLIFAVMWGYVFFADIPTFETFIGIVLIILSGIIVTFSERIEDVISRHNKALESRQTRG